MTLPSPPPLRDDVASTLASAQELVNWIAIRQDGQEVRTGNSTRIPALLLDLALEHHVGIVHLVTGRMNGPAFALIRTEFEAYVRAVWLHLCAKPQELKAFVEKDTLPLKFGQMIEAIESQKDFVDKVLSGLKKSTWTAMSGYTHGGMHQVARRVKGGSIEPNYESDEVIEVLKVSGFFALMALRQIARLAGDGDLEKEVTARLVGQG
ncbi:MAG: hypothetical protein WCK83_16620 [Burkholderiales bacterium]